MKGQIITVGGTRGSGQKGDGGEGEGEVGRGWLSMPGPPLGGGMWGRGVGPGKLC
jgi:hypothetical protein